MMWWVVFYQAERETEPVSLGDVPEAIDVIQAVCAVAVVRPPDLADDVRSAVAVDVQHPCAVRAEVLIEKNTALPVLAIGAETPPAGRHRFPVCLVVLHLGRDHLQESVSIQVRQFQGVECPSVGPGIEQQSVFPRAVVGPGEHGEPRVRVELRLGDDDLEGTVVVDVPDADAGLVVPVQGRVDEWVHTPVGPTPIHVLEPALVGDDVEAGTVREVSDRRPVPVESGRSDGRYPLTVSPDIVEGERTESRRILDSASLLLGVRAALEIGSRVEPDSAVLRERTADGYDLLEWYQPYATP